MKEPTLYRAYGLCIASEVDLPALVPAASATVDVTIRYGDVFADWGPVEPHCWAYRTEAESFSLEVGGVARYLVLGGREITVQPVSGSDRDGVRVYLLGSALGALLHQRNILAMHASAIETSQGAVLFLGDSGVGKSTLLAAFLKRGYSMVADDVTGVRLDGDGRPIALPAFPRVRLWADSASTLDLPVDGLERVSRDHRKYDLPVTAFRSNPLPLRAAYVLTAADTTEFALERIDARSGFELLANQTYRAEFLDGLVQRRAHFNSIAATADAARLRRVVRPRAPFLLEELVSAIRQDLLSVNDQSAQ